MHRLSENFGDVELRALVIGANGQLGKSLMSLESEGLVVVGTSRNREMCENSDLLELDIRNDKEISRIVHETRPDLVINAAAMTDVDGCEKDPKLAERINGRAPKIIAQNCNKVGAKMIQVSTDYVFDGSKGMYREEDDTSPIQAYGKTKLSGEENVKGELGSDSAIVRTSVVFSKDSKNFVSWIINSIKCGKSISIVEDQFVTPTSAGFLAEAIFSLFVNGCDGVWNVCSKGKISRYDMAKIIAKIIGEERPMIRKIKMADLNWLADRPMDSSLDCSKSSKIIDVKSFDEMISDLFSERNAV